MDEKDKLIQKLQSEQDLLITALAKHVRDKARGAVRVSTAQNTKLFEAEYEGMLNEEFSNLNLTLELQKKIRAVIGRL